MFYDKMMVGAEYTASCAPVDALQAACMVEAAFVAPAVQSAPTRFKPPKGIWLDHGQDFREPEGDPFTRHVLGLIQPFEKLKNKRSEKQTRHHYTRVRKVLANGLRCFYYFDPALVAFIRHGGRLRGKPEWFTGTGMNAVTDAMCEAGLITINTGEQGTAPTYEATEALLFAALDFGVTEASLTHCITRERLVRMYETNRDGPYAAFDPNDETECWTAKLEAFNGFLDQQDIALDLSFAEQARVVGCLNYKRDRDLPRYHTPDLSRTHLFRQFNNGTFDEGGRLYGGWWISIPKHLRSRMTINGNQTVELDYSGSAIRMLYNLHGIDCPDDPYCLKEIAALEVEQGLPADHYREAVKALTQARINGTNREKDMMCSLPDGLSFAPHFKRDAVTRMIEAKHEAIADDFGSGAGIRLQRLDSDLALSIITGLMEEGIVALPIHDSFIVEAIHKDRLFEEMNDKYKERFGFNPVIK
jgi:hypothetical protein